MRYHTNDRDARQKLESFDPISEIPLERIDDFIANRVAQYPVQTFFGKQWSGGALFFTIGDEKKQNLVRLYSGTGLPSVQTQPLVDNLFPKEEVVYRLKVPAFNINLLPKPTSRTEAIHELARLEWDIDGDGRYYAGAEVLVRAVAHKLFPGNFNMPTALVTTDGDPVGFYTSYPRAIKSYMDHWEEMSEKSYRINDSTPPEVTQIVAALKKFNIEPYSDLRERVFLDGQGKFVMFDRIGYTFLDPFD